MPEQLRLFTDLPDLVPKGVPIEDIPGMISARAAQAQAEREARGTDDNTPLGRRDRFGEHDHRFPDHPRLGETG